MSFVKGLVCRECGHEYPKEPIHVCEYCFGPLEVGYDYDKISGSISRDSIQQRDYNIWRYRELLPIDGEPTVGRSVGYTPLIKADRLAAVLGVKELYIKNDAVCFPTLSFKDRVVSVALSKAKEFGFDTVSCASTGNLANAVSALSTASGLKSFIFIPKDLELSKIVGTSIYNTNLVEINGHYDDVNRLCSEIAGSFGWGFVNINLRPYYAEGSKSFAFEFMEQLGWKVPDNVVIPMASGSLLTKIWKAINEFEKLGLIEGHSTKIYGAQATGCSPISTAVKNEWEIFKPQKPDTIAKSISIGNPADGYYAMKAIRESEGWSEDVSDPEIVDAIKLLAQTEGIFTETAGGVTVAVTKKLIENNKINKKESILISITGNGLKTQEPLMDKITMPHNINADIKEFQELYDNITKNSKEDSKKCHP